MVKKKKNGDDDVLYNFLESYERLIEDFVKFLYDLRDASDVDDDVKRDFFDKVKEEFKFKNG